MWTELDPKIAFLLHNSLQSFRHELLVSNFEGIPTLQQHGSVDDNVPNFHSRRMNQLISQSKSIACSDYVELSGKGHWFDGVMSTSPLRKFYAATLSREAKSPALPQDFSIVVANPADMGPRGGLVVDQLDNPDQLGKIDVRRALSTSTWVVQTSNIRTFHFVPSNSVKIPLELIVDNDLLRLSLHEDIFSGWLIRSKGSHWRVRTSVEKCHETS